MAADPMIIVLEVTTKTVFTDPKAYEDQVRMLLGSKHVPSECVQELAKTGKTSYRKLIMRNGISETSTHLKARHLKFGKPPGGIN